eukprot:COSAG02_NODE_36135_length_458_cov_1.144847_2_plen_47_part_01
MIRAILIGANKLWQQNFCYGSTPSKTGGPCDNYRCAVAVAAIQGQSV